MRRSCFRGFRFLILLIAVATHAACSGGAGCAPTGGNIVQLPPASGADFYVMANRQKVIGLTGYFPGVEYDNVSFSILTPPANGQLLGTAPNLTYVPDAGYVGTDSFTYRASAGGNSRDRTVTLAVADAFVPPAGIPTPAFGISQSHTMYAGEQYDYAGTTADYNDAGNGPFTHYVDFNTGDDTGNPFGTPASPRRTIPANLTPGSVVEVHGTDINYSSRITLTGEGTIDKPIFVRGASPTAKPVFRVPISVEGNFIICENLEFNAQDFVTGVIGPIWFWVTSSQAAPYKVFHDIALRHSLVRDQPTNTTANPFGVAVGVGASDASLNDPTKLIENVVIYDIEVRNFSQWNDFNGTNDNGGCTFMSNTRYGWVVDCHLHHIQGDGVGMSRSNGLSNQAPARSIYVGRNYLHNFKENCIDYKLCVDSIASQNICHTVRASNSSLGEAITVHDDDQTADYPGCDNIWLIFNTVYDAEIALSHENEGLLTLGKSSRSYLVGNILFDIRNIRGNPNVTGIGIHKGQEAQSRIIGNTIYNCDHGIWIGLPLLTRPGECTQVIRNNAIFELTERYKTTNGKDGMAVYVTPDTVVPYTTMDHNLFYESTGNVRINITEPGLMDGDYSDVAALLAATGLGADSLVADPAISNAGLQDFHLTASSPCRLAGANDDAYATFQAAFGLSLDYYQDGISRPAGRYDIGALGDE